MHFDLLSGSILLKGVLVQHLVCFRAKGCPSHPFKGKQPIFIALSRVADGKETDALPIFQREHGSTCPSLGPTVTLNCGDQMHTRVEA